MAIFFFNGLGLSLGANLVSVDDRPSYYSVAFSLFPSGSEKISALCTFHEPVGGTPSHVCRHLRAKNRRFDLPVFNIKQNLARKLDPALKPGNLKEITYLTTFCGPKANCPRWFWEIAHDILETCSTCPSRGMISRCVSVFHGNHLISKVRHIFQKS